VPPPPSLGHALFLSEDLYDRLVDLGIPIEICPTSNMKTLEVVVVVVVVVEVVVVVVEYYYDSRGGID